jgi:glycosyltransferase involved in cell wall biosynthesis
MGADPLLQPLTGIGSYTNNLVKSLQSENLVGDLLLFANGIFLENSFSERSESSSADFLESTRISRESLLLRKLRSVRGYLAKSNAAVNIYRRLMPLIEKKRLLSYGDYIFHSPNYLLPDFDGPKVMTLHDLSIQLYPEFHPLARVKLLERAMVKSINNAQHIITDSECVKSQAEAVFGIASSRISAIPLGTGPQFRVRSSSQCKEILDEYELQHKKFFLFVGTIEPRKNLRRICSAYKILREEKGFDWPIVFVGSQGWESSAEHADIQGLVNRGWALYLGYASERILPILYSAAGALVFPSIYEGYGLPAMEAQQSGTRVITSKNTSMAEFSCERDILVDPLETGDIVKAMREVVSDAKEGFHIGLGEVIDRASWGDTARQTAHIYRKIS